MRLSRFIKPMEREHGKLVTSWFRRNWERAHATRIGGLVERTAIGATNTTLNGICGLELQPLAEKAKRIEKEHPETTRVSKYGSIYLLSLGQVYIGKLLSRTPLGEVGGYTLALTMPFIVNVTVNVIRSLIGKGSGIFTTLKGSVRQGTYPAFSAIFGLMEVVSTPLFLYLIPTLATLGGKSENAITPLRAVVALFASNAALLVSEWAVFREAWKRLVRKDTMPSGTWRDFFQGFGETFSLRNLVRTKPSPMPRNVSHEAGQLFGISESYYMWVQAIRFATAAAIGMYGMATEKNFLPVFLDTLARYGGWVMMDVLAAFNTIHMSRKLEETKEGLGT